MLIQCPVQTGLQTNNTFTCFSFRCGLTIFFAQSSLGYGYSGFRFIGPHPFKGNLTRLSIWPDCAKYGYYVIVHFTCDNYCYNSVNSMQYTYQLQYNSLRNRHYTSYTGCETCWYAAVGHRQDTTWHSATNTCNKVQFIHKKKRSRVVCFVLPEAFLLTASKQVARAAVRVLLNPCSVKQRSSTWAACLATVCVTVGSTVFQLVFHRDSQLSVTAKSVLPSFSVSSSALDFKMGPLILTPFSRTATNHCSSACSTSGSFPHRLRFPKERHPLPFSLNLVRSSASCLSSPPIVVFGTFSISANCVWLVPLGWECILSRKAIFSERLKSLHAYNLQCAFAYTWKNHVYLYSTCWDQWLKWILRSKKN